MTFTDTELLQRYARHDASAFDAFVRRHLDLVYSAALRQSGGDAHLAQEITQDVFIAAARKAASLAHHPALTGWLYRTTRFAAIDARRKQSRRSAPAEEIRTMLYPDEAEPAREWEQVRPIIDETMNELRASDRDAILLRYFKHCSFAEVATHIGTSENTARMRVERALEKLQGRLIRRGITSTGAALASALSTYAITPAPAGIAAAVTQTCVAAAGGAGGGAVLTFLQIMIAKKITIAALSGVLAAGLTSLFWSQQLDSGALETLKIENDALRQQLRSAISNATPPAESPGNVTVQPPSAVASTSANEEADAPATPPPTSAPATSPRNENRGQAEPRDALHTFAWASERGEVDALAKVLHLDPEARARAEEIRKTLPPDAQERWSTPEELCALLIAGDALGFPPPPVSLLEETEIVELRPGRAVFVFRPPGRTAVGHEYQQTGDGWKYVLPKEIVDSLAALAMRGDMLAKPPPN